MSVWQEKRLGEVLKKRVERGVPGLPIMSVTMQGLKPRSELDRRTESNLPEEAHLTARKNDLVYNTMRMWQGVAGLVDIDCLVSPAYVVCQPTEDICPRFFSYLFKYGPTIKKFENNAFGLTGDRLRLYYDDFARIKIMIPPLKEQKKIAEILSTWDRAIEKVNLARDRVELYQRLRLNLFFRSLGGISETVRLGDVCDVKSGGTPNRGNSAYYENGNIPWLKSGEVAQGEIFKSEEFITKLGLEESAANIIPAETPVVAMYGATAGKVGILRNEMAINQAVAAVVLKDNHLTSEYIYLCLRYLAPSLLKKVQGSGQPNLNAGMIKELKIPLCNLEQQELATKFIMSIFKQVETYEKLSLLISKQKQGLMQQLLTGKVRVKV